jgi:hypothetical protein
MEDKTSPIDALFERAEEYSKTSIELLKLKLLDKTTDVASSSVSSLAITFLLLVFLLFMSLGIALWLGEILGKSFYGFFIVAAFYFITGAVLYIFRHKWIKNIVSRSIIQRVLN